MKSWTTVLILAIVAGTSTIAFAVQDTVIIQSFTFIPDTITIHEGDTIVLDKSSFNLAYVNQR